MAYFCLVAFVVFATAKTSVSEEPVCSKFDFEMRTLETMLRTENSVEKMKAEVMTTQEFVRDKLNQIDDYKAQITYELEQFKQSLQTEANRQVEEMKKEKKLLDDRFKHELREQDGLAAKLNTGPVIAFSVVLPTGIMVNGVPTFKHVITNIGNAYRKDTGVFTSPLSGLYFFFLSIYAVGTENSYCRILHNGSHVVIAQSNIYDRVTGSNAVYLSLKKGDIVSPGDCNGVKTFHQVHRGTTFSGRLIQIM